MMERAEGYIKGVKSGKIVAGKWIKLAINRHLADLKRAKKKDFPYFFSQEHAEHAIGVFGVLKLAKGKKSGQPFDLMPWQACILYMLYGWRRKSNGLRRFRKLYCKVARGNAKTEFLAGIGTIGFLFEGEKDSEVYWVATKKDQAKIGWGRQKAMTERLLADEPELKNLITVAAHKIFTKQGLGWVYYLGQDSDTEDGGSPYYALVDEFHAHPNDEMLNVIESGMGKRDDPLTAIITTAGYKPAGPNSLFLKACKNVLSGVLENEELLAFVYELDPDDDWKDEANWVKANPSIGVSVNLDSLRSERNKVVTQGLSKEIDFKVKNLNIEYQSQDGWIPDDLWQKNEGVIDEEDLRGRLCFGGLDLASVSDTNAFCLFFPKRHEDEPHVLKWWFWLPRDTVELRSQHVNYPQWVRDGWITATTGWDNVADYRQIRSDMLEAAALYDIESVQFDRWNKMAIVPDLVEDGLNMVEFGQGYGSMSTPSKTFERMVLSQECNTGGNPVARWMNGNVFIERNPAGDIKPNKKKSSEKIDGIVAAIQAVGGWLTYLGDNNQTKSYLFADGAELQTF